MCALRIVVDRHDDWRPYYPTDDPIDADGYLSRADADRSHQVINLCSDLDYLGTGYYVSLLAQARGDRVLPSVDTLNTLRRKSTTDMQLEGLAPILESGHATPMTRGIAAPGGQLLKKASVSRLRVQTEPLDYPMVLKIPDGAFSRGIVKVASAAQLVVEATRLIGNGLYGVDLKQIGERILVIEVNDDPNIDAGIEDVVLGSQLYDRVMQVFLARMETRRRLMTSNRPGRQGSTEKPIEVSGESSQPPLQASPQGQHKS